MASAYIQPPIETDVDAITANALDYLVANVPGFVPREGHLEVWLVEAMARLVAEGMAVAARVPKQIFAYFGQSLLGLPPVRAAAATLSSTWTMADAAGYTIPGGTLVAVRTAGDGLAAFRVITTFTVDPGATATPDGAVRLAALVGGTAGNGLGPGPMEPIDSLAFVESVAATTTSSGGTDPETDDQYLDRLVNELRLLAPRPILPADFSQMAMRVPGVGAAIALDGYNPDTATFGNERTVTVGVIGPDGIAVGAEILAAVDTLLQTSREVNFIVRVVNPNFTDVTVAYTIKVRPGYVPATVQAQVDAAIRSYLDPVLWARSYWPSTEAVVRWLMVGGVIARISGVETITALTVNGAAANLNLAGAVPLPRPVAVIGTLLP